MILDNRQRFRKQVLFGDQAKRCGCFCAASCREASALHQTSICKPEQQSPPWQEMSAMAREALNVSTSYFCIAVLAFGAYIWGYRVNCNMQEKGITVESQKIHHG